MSTTPTATDLASMPLEGWPIGTIEEAVQQLSAPNALALVTLAHHAIQGLINDNHALQAHLAALEQSHQGVESAHNLLLQEFQVLDSSFDAF